MKENRRPSSAISCVKESIPFVNAIRLQENFTARAERSFGGGIVAIAGTTLMLVVSAIGNTVKLYRAETLC